jgi:hypothetical protein
MPTPLPQPSYLENFDLLQQHIRGQLEGLSTTEKGKRFARFVQRLVPQSDAGTGFDMPELNTKISNDGGIDLTGYDKRTHRNFMYSVKVIY